MTKGTLASILLICISIIVKSNGVPLLNDPFAISNDLYMDPLLELLADPCIRASCSFGEICVQNKDRITFSCISEKTIALNMRTNNIRGEELVQSLQAPPRLAPTANEPKFTSYPENFVFSYLRYDPCLSSPCPFGKVCKNSTLSDVTRFYECVDEAEKEGLSKSARDFYRTMENKYKASINTNIDKMLEKTQLAGGFRSGVTRLKASGDKKDDPCTPNPCKITQKCELSETHDEGYICVAKNETITVDKTPSLDELCKDREFGDRVAHPKIKTQFLSCLHDGGYTLLSCPDDLVYNKYLDRCDLGSEPLKAGCGSMPCQYGAKCIDLPNDEYKCHCPEGYSGVNCQIAPDFCASNPCGDSGTCHSLPWDSPLPYYCTCSNEKLYGMSCDETSEKNPCINDPETNIFPTKIDPAIFVHCNDDKLELKYCHSKSLFSIDTNSCEWIQIEEKKKEEKIKN